MAFVKYEVDQPELPQVKITKIALVIGKAAWERAGLTGADNVNLYFDRQSSRIGISSTTPDDRNRFPVKTTARGVSIAAKKFFTKFAITSAEAVSDLQEAGEVVAFKIKLTGAEPAIAAEVVPPAKRRGRPPKNGSSA